MSRSNRHHPMLQVAMLFVGGVFNCGESRTASRSLVPSIAEHIEISTYKGTYFYADLVIPAGYERSGDPHLGSVRWERERGPTIRLERNPHENGIRLLPSRLDPHRRCLYPQLEIPLVDGEQVACVGSGEVERFVVFDDDVLRCSVESGGGELERLEDAWALCAEMKVLRVRPSLTPFESNRMLLADLGSVYEIAIELPRHYRAVTENDQEKTFFRGSAEPHISVELNQSRRPKIGSGLDPIVMPCGKSGEGAVEWRTANVTACRHHVGWGYPDHFSINRFIVIGADVVSCSASVKQSELQDIANVCETLRVTRRATK